MKRPVTIPKWVKRYPAVPNAAQFKQLETKVIDRYLAKEYNQLLSRYNAIYRFNWIKHNDRKVIDLDHTWKQYMKPYTGQLYLLKSKTNTRVFAKCMGLLPDSKNNITPWNKDTRMAFQSVSVLEQLLLDLPSNGDLQLTGVGVRLGKGAMEGVSEIEPLLEEAQNRYKDLDYNKLLSIAKQGQKGVGAGGESRQAAKLFLERLAKQNIMHPSTTTDGQWLLFSRDREEEPPIP